MADMKISDLPAAPNVNDAQQFEVNDSGNSRSVTFLQLRDQIKNQFDSVYMEKNAGGQYHGPTLTYSTTPSHWNNLPDEYPHTGIIDKLVYSHSGNGGPGIDHYYYVQQFFYSYYNINVTQLAIPYLEGRIVYRNRYKGAWSAWKRVANTDTPLSEFTGNLPYSRISGAPSSSLPTAMGIGSWLLCCSYNNLIDYVDYNVAGSNIYALRLKYGYPSGNVTAEKDPYIHPPGTWKNMGPYAATAIKPAFFMRVA